MQLSESCSENNAAQLIVGANVETAVAHDCHAVEPMLEQLQEGNCLPDTLLGDAAYGSDKNVQLAEDMGVELVSPTINQVPPNPDALTLDDFAHHEVTGAVEACPASHSPSHVAHEEVTSTTATGDVVKTIKTIVTMSAQHCASCPLLALCPIKKRRDGSYQLEFTDKAVRLAARRREESTEVFRERYARRAGIESTNSGLKNRLGLGQLRVRGSPAVTRVTMNKMTGWNVLRGCTTEAVRKWVATEIEKLDDFG